PGLPVTMRGLHEVTMRVLSIALLFAVCLPGQTASRPERVDLKVLYAGVPGPRTEEWRAFLEARTAACTTITTEQVTRAAADGFDVVVVDCPDPIVRNDQGGVERLNV